MSHEDADVVKIRSFVTKCLESVGTLVEFTAYNYAEVLIPDELIDYFDGENYYKLAFDFDVARRHQEAELVTYGSYFLDKVLDLASQRGLTCRRHIVDEALELRNLPQKIAGRITLRNQKMNFVANSPVLYHYLLFSFKVSYVSDEREDQIIKLLVNLNTGHVDNRMLESIGSAFFTDNPHTNYGAENMQSVDYAYKIATEALDEQIQPKIHEIQNKIRIRLIGEKNRITEYYDQIDNELKLKLEKLNEKENKEGANTINDKLRLSMIERQRRLKEIEEKNALNAYVTLFNATLISQTKIRNKYNVKKGKTERDIYVVWNPILKDVEPLICEICGTETFDVDLCSGSHLGCKECVSLCSICGTRICKSCGTFSECRVCGVFLCDKCKYLCENCGDILCKDHIESCTCKTEKRCNEQESEMRKKEEHILEFQKNPLSLSKSVKQYMDEYIKKNIDSLDEDWKKALVKLQSVLTVEDKIKARETLSELNEKYPDNAWIKARLILTYERFSSRLMSLSHHAVSIAPQLAISHTAYGYMLQKNGELTFDKAIDEYEKAIRLAGDDEIDLKANAHYQIGKILQDYMGDWWEARHRLEMALEIDPGLQSARQALNNLKTLMRGRYRF
jgi:tetratricopeptide (TPR) repeat protein